MNSVAPTILRLATPTTLWHDLGDISLALAAISLLVWLRCERGSETKFWAGAACLIGMVLTGTGLTMDRYVRDPLTMTQVAHHYGVSEHKGAWHKGLTTYDDCDMHTQASGGHTDVQFACIPHGSTSYVVLPVVKR